MEITWFKSSLELEQFIGKESDNLNQYRIVISDIYFGTSRTGLDLWLEYEKALRNKMILVSSLEPRQIDHFLGDRDYYPFYLKKPFSLPEARELINWILEHDVETALGKRPKTMVPKLSPETDG